MKNNVSIILFISLLILECINEFILSSNDFSAIHLFYLMTQIIPLIGGIILSIVIHKNEEVITLKKINIALFIYQGLNILSGVLVVIHFPILLLLLFFSKGWLICILNMNKLNINSIIRFIEMILFIVSCVILNFEIAGRLKKIVK